MTPSMLSNETPMGFLPVPRPGAPLAPRRCLTKLWPPTSCANPVAAGLVSQHIAEDMLLRNAEVQYVCRNVARQSHGRPIQLSPPRLAVSSRTERRRERNDLLFRPG